MKQTLARWVLLGTLATSSACSGSVEHGTEGGGSAAYDGGAGAAPDGAGGVPAPDPGCSDCYVVNTSLTTPKTGEMFVSGYVGNDLDSFIRLFDGSRWQTLHAFNALGGMLDLWGSTDTGLYGLVQSPTATESEWRVHHFDVATGLLEDLGVPATALWAHNEGCVYAMSQGAVQRFDGASWSDLNVEATDLTDISGMSCDDVVVLRATGSLLHFDGATWTPWPGALSAEVKDISVAAATSVFGVVGSDHPDGTGPGFIAHHDGAGWTVVQEAPDDALLAVANNGNGLTYGVGASRDGDGDAHAVVWRGRAGAWERFELANVPAFLWDVSCVPGGDCLAVGTDNTVVALSYLP